MEIGETYQPTHRAQFGWGTPDDHDNCGPTSTAMMIDWSTIGATRPTPPQVRDAVGHSGNTNLDDCIRAATHFGVNIHEEDLDVAGIVTKLSSGIPLIVYGDYEKITDPFSCQPTFDGLHAMFFQFLDNETGEIYAHDPLCHRPQWYPQDMLMKYARAYPFPVGPKIKVGVAERLRIKAAKTRTTMAVHRWPSLASRIVATLPVDAMLRYGEFQNNFYRVWGLDNVGVYRPLFVNGADAQKVPNNV